MNMTPNHGIQPTYLPSLRYGKSAADAERSASDCIYPKQWSTIPTCKSLQEP